MFGEVPQKLNTKVKVQDFLFLEMAPMAVDTGAYDLNSYVKHKGHINAGHYISTIKKHDNWVLISDELAGLDNMEHLASNGSPEVYLMAFVKHSGK
jgi:ubiquitin C-terminal hydrolase